MSEPIHSKEHVKPLVYFQVRIGVSLAVLLVGTVLISLYIAIPNWRETLKFIGAVAGAMAALISSYYLAESFRLRLTFEKQQKVKDKKAASLRFSFIDDPEICPIVLRLHEHLEINSRGHREITSEEFEKFPNEKYP